MPETSTQDIHQQHTLELNSPDGLPTITESSVVSPELELFELDTGGPEQTPRKSKFVVNTDNPIRGGTGEIFQAYDSRLDRVVLVKKLFLGEDNEELLREGRNQAKVGGHISAMTFDVQEDSAGNYYLIMEDLSDRYELLHNCRGTMSLADYRSLVIGLTDAIGQIHKHGLLHRDIKPKNIFFTRGAETPKVKVIDFGLAIDVSDANTQLIIGTIDYMAPELLPKPSDAIQTPQYSIQSDIYAMGMTLYDVFMGQTAIQVLLVKDLGEACEKMADKERIGKKVQLIRERAIEFPPEFYGRCDAWEIDPHELRLVFEKVLHKEPKSRYQTIGEFETALQRVLNNHVNNQGLSDGQLRFGFSGKPRVFRPEESTKYLEL